MQDFDPGDQHSSPVCKVDAFVFTKLCHIHDVTKLELEMRLLSVAVLGMGGA